LIAWSVEGEIVHEATGSSSRQTNITGTNIGRCCEAIVDKFISVLKKKLEQK
jgi:hypothetical protein